MVGVLLRATMFYYRPGSCLSVTFVLYRSTLLAEYQPSYIRQNRSHLLTGSFSATARFTYSSCTASPLPLSSIPSIVPLSAQQLCSKISQFSRNVMILLSRNFIWRQFCWSQTHWRGPPENRRRPQVESPKSQIPLRYSGRRQVRSLSQIC